MKNLRIGVDVRSLDSLHATGIDMYLGHILASWSKLKLKHTLVMFGTPANKSHPIIKSILHAGHEFVVQPWPNKVFNASVKFLHYPKIDTLLKGVDVFFLPNPMFLALSKKVRLVATFHDLTFERTRNIYSAKHNFWHHFVDPRGLAERADSLIAVSASTKRDLRQLYNIPESDITVIGLSNSLQSGVKSHPLEGSFPEKYILYLGSIEPRKNISAVLRAFEKIQQSFPDVHLVLAGSFFPQPDDVAIERAATMRNVHILGYVSSEQKKWLYENALLAVLVSFYEGFGLPLLEAVAANIPVIASSVTSVPEVVGANALLVNPFNVSELVCAMRSILSDKKLSADLKLGYGELLEKFNWDTTAARTLEVLELSAGK